MRTHTHIYGPAHRRGMARPRVEPAAAQGMLRKNITITPDQSKFLDRHPEINQSALFRQVVESLMLAERSPGSVGTQPVRLGRGVYRSGAVMYQKREE